MPDRSHPIWAILRLLIIGTILSIYLIRTAVKFDHTELVIILLVLALIGGDWAVGKLLGKWFCKSNGAEGG